MPIPKEILAVKRPVNTVVIAYGKEKKHYAVRKRIGCHYVNGRHLPVNGPTIGHIKDGKYIPMTQEPISATQVSDIDLKDWANITLCNQVFADMLAELSAIYTADDACRIYCIAILRVCYPGIKDSELKEKYETSFLSELYPGIALSRNTVSDFQKNLGKTCSKIIEFMKTRAAAVMPDHHLLVDGTLKSDDSKINSLSDFSWKAPVKGTRDISVLYAFDLEEQEPVCSQCFPGNMLDLTAYESFIQTNGITKGLIVADKGFPAKAAEHHFSANPDLHYLNPIKRNSKLIERHNMLCFNGLLDGYENITFRKEKCSGKNKWLYAFRDAAKAAQEEQDYLKRAKANGNYSCDAFKEKQKSFGVIVLECDLDLTPKIVYKAYAERWKIEIVMRYYKNACQFNETRVHDDYSVIGSEFCDFLATILTFRLLKKFDAVHLLDQRNYSKIMSILCRAKKIRLSKQPWQLIKVNPSHLEILQNLGLLSKPEETPKRKPGRPRKYSV